MVNINLTLVIELVLFLIFLWGTARLVLRPALETIDGREEKVEKEIAETEAAIATAVQLEAQYADAITAVRIEAEDAFRDASARAMDAHAAKMADARRALHDRVAEVREEGRQILKAQRAQLLAAAPAVADEMKRRLEVGMRG